MLSRLKNSIRPASLSALFLLSGCSPSATRMLSPATEAASGQLKLIFIAIGLMLIVLIPVWLMAFWFPMRYREDKSGERYQPGWNNSALIETIVWVVPALIVIAIGTLVWVETHHLDPYRLPYRQALGTKPLTIEAISLDWKWVFLYPDGEAATVNELVVPVNHPVRLHLTSDTAMTSFFVPGIAGQIYAMAGMDTELNFLPNKTGTFMGRNMQYTGGEFPDQQFILRVVSPKAYADFRSLVAKSDRKLTEAGYEKLKSDKDKSGIIEYAQHPESLYRRVIDSYCATGCRQGEK